MGGRLTTLLAPALLLAVLLAGWELACRAWAVSPAILPSPSAIGLAALANGPDLLASAWRTLATALIALVLASLIACVAALIVSLSPLLERAVQPIVTTLQVTPVIAIAPLLVIWAGIEHPERAVTALAVIVAFFPIYSGAVAGLKAADPDLMRLFDVHGASAGQKLLRLRLPSATPHLLEGHKVGAGLALVGAVVAEWVAGAGNSEGLAWRILEAEHRLEGAKMFAALLVLALMGAAFYGLLQVAERVILRQWRGR
jgi:NitT/TauT family transport system permease protein